MNDPVTTPASATSDNTLLYVAGAVGAVALGYLAYRGVKAASPYAAPLFLPEHLLPHYEAVRKAETPAERAAAIRRGLAAHRAAARAEMRGGREGGLDLGDQRVAFHPFPRDVQPTRVEGFPVIEEWRREPDVHGKGALWGRVYGKRGAADGSHITTYPAGVEGPSGKTYFPAHLSPGDIVVTETGSRYRLGRPRGADGGVGLPLGPAGTLRLGTPRSA
jgi:hypothetical protein